MSTVSSRIPVLVTPEEKKRIAKRARAAGVSVGEFLRQAASAFSPDEDNAMLEQLVVQVERSTASASAAIDDALDHVERSNQRIAAMEAAVRRRA